MTSLANPPLRRDAQRNRDRLIAVARDAFAAGEAPSLEAVARAAGVGIGTLYRHFPTREALVEAVYLSELQDVCARAERLAGSGPPDRVLRAWMDRYAEFGRTKRGMADTLRAVLEAGAGSDTRSRIRAAVALLLEAGVRAGVLRADVTADDVVVAMIGVCLATAGDVSPDRAGRLLDLLLDGLRVAG